MDFKKAYDSVRREALYNILIEFGIPKKLVRLVKMCLTVTSGWARICLRYPEFAGSNPAEAVGFFRAKKSSACLPSEGK
jgi:hypothetical protein